jgi:hypothetical protein
MSFGNEMLTLPDLHNQYRYFSLTFYYAEYLNLWHLNWFNIVGTVLWHIPMRIKSVLGLYFKAGLKSRLFSLTSPLNPLSKGEGAENGE